MIHNRALRSVLRKLKPLDRKLRRSSLYKKSSDKAVRRVYGKTASAVSGYEAARLHLAERSTIAIRSDQVFLDSFWGRALSGNTYAVYASMRQDPQFDNHRFVWVCRPATEMPDGIANDPNVAIVDFGSPDYFNELAASSLIIHNANLSRYYAKRAGQTVVHLFHGVPLKRMGLDVTQNLLGAANTQRNFLMADVVMSASPAMTERIIDAYNAESNRDNVVYSGFPRLDLTLNESFLPAAIDETALESSDTSAHDSNPNDDEPAAKIKVLYAPTWRGAVGSVDVSGLGNQLATLERFAVELQDTHDFVVSVHNYAQNEAGKLPDNCVYIDPKVPINVLLAEIDVLVTDYSSIVVDAIAADIPSILYAYDEDEYNATRGLYEPLSVIPAAVCRTEHEVSKALVAARPPSDFEQYEQFCKKFTLHEDGRATERIMQAIQASEARGHSERTDERHTILFAAADLSVNRIATELQSLLEHLDHSKYAVTVLVRTRLIDRSARARARYLELRRLGCEVIMISGRAVVPKEQAALFKKLREGRVKGAAGLDRAWDELTDVFTYEVERHLAGRTYDSVVDFGGQSVWWAGFCASVPASNRVIWRRSGPSGGVGRTIRYLTRDFDAVCTPDIQKANAVRLGKYEVPQPLTWVLPAAPKHVEQRRAALKGRGKSLTLVKRGEATGQTYRHFVAVGYRPKPGQVATLLEGFSDYLQTDPFATLTLLSGPKTKADFTTARRMLNLTGNVRRDNMVSNPAALFEAAELVIGLGDSSGVTALVEAARLGTPVVGIGLEDFESIGLQPIPCRREIISEAFRNPRKFGGPDFDAYHESLVEAFEEALRPVVIAEPLST